jgi:hypothetical protein
MRLHTLAKLAGALSICLVMAATASAQYGGGTTGGTTGGATGTGTTGSGTPNYNYGSGKAIGIGIGAAAGAAAAVALLVHHHHKAKSKAQALLIGCTQPAATGISLKSDQDGQTYLLVSKKRALQAGERVELAGALKSDASGVSAFRVKDVVTDFGACSATVASAPELQPKQLAIAAE